MKTLVLLLSIISLFGSFAKELTSSERALIEKYENELEQLVKSKKTPSNNLYYIYLIVARDFHFENIEDYYLKYLNKAKNLDVKEDKSEAYWRLTNHYRVSGDLDRAKKLYKEWESTGQVTNQVMSQAFDILKMSLFDTAMSKDERKVLENGPFSYRFKMDNLDSLIKSKQYAKAFALIDPKHLEGEMVSTIIRYDLLGSLVLGKAYKNILCEETYNKYPKSLSYSVKLCKSLLEFRQSGKIAQATLEETQAVFKNNIYKNDKFLYSALLDLK